ncbi:MAG: hypothetical protein QUV07_08425 [Cyanobium sp. CZS 25K]|nr:hypothetical protein [Cyanobium sp. CZS25K]
MGSGNDFLAPVKLASTPAGGAQRLSWSAIPTALGYQATATGMGRQEGDIVMGTSSELPMADSAVPDDLRAPEAARLVQRGVLLGEGMERLDPGSGEGQEAPAPKGGGFNLFKLF